MASSQTQQNINGETPSPDDEKIADDLRRLAFKIAMKHHVGATLLTIAAAAIAPTGDIDAEIVEHFFQELGLLENHLTWLHHEQLVREDPEGRLTTDGIMVEAIEGDLGERLQAFVNRSTR